MSTSDQKINLIFVYNADSGKLNTMFDIAHKIFRPDTYECSLCLLTHEIFTENKLLASLKNNTKFNIEFLHKDEFQNRYNMEFTYPVILEKRDHIKILLDHKQISAINNIKDLIDILEQKYSAV
ncbi:hypothetical protein PQO03_08800 [Lentisphaera profundi]|uniref:GTPase n=1 Tax=Lentisphaera profundi TaxID=1658616 RepID=A0ABY7VQ19_9BACT|nr:hypothetical protein [Lentisphaera profundi]WDE95812.1 hypothetical protein PQO03_08800 [Lentisphaera profundi]